MEGRRANTWLANGWKAVLWALVGDLDYFVAMLGTPNYALVSGPCMHCRCKGVGDFTWSDFRPEANWRATRWDPEEWRNWDQRTKCELLTLPGASCWTIAYDWVHVKYLGVDQYIFGSVLCVLVTMVMDGEKEQNLARCWDFLKNYFKVNHTRTPYRYLSKLSMFIRSGNKFPKLRGKASEIRLFGNPLLALWENFCNPAIILHQRITLMLKYNINMEEILTAHKDEFVLPAGVAAQFEDSANLMLLLLTQVADHFVEDGLKVFDITSKTHMLQELAVLSRAVNPRVTWCFMGEDMQQRMQQITKCCVRGNRIDKQNEKLARHYRLALHLHFVGVAL